MSPASITTAIQQLSQPRTWLPRNLSALGIDVGTHCTKILWLNKSWSTVREVCCLRIPTTHTLDSMADRSNVEAWRPSFDRLAQQASRAIRAAEVRSLQSVAAAVSMAWGEIISVDCNESLTNPSSPALQQRLSAMGGQDSKLCSAEFIKPHLANECFDGRRFLCMPEQISLDLVSALQNYRLELDRLEGAPWALARSLQLVADPAQVEVLIDWGYSAVTLVACHQQEFLFCRKLTCPALRGIVARLEESFSLSSLAANRLLERLSMPATGEPANERRAEDTCLRILNEHTCHLMQEIQVSLKYLAWRMPSLACQRLWVSGGGACAPVLMDLLNQRSPVPCQPWSWQPASHVSPLTADMAIAAALAQGE